MTLVLHHLAIEVDGISKAKHIMCRRMRAFERFSIVLYFLHMYCLKLVQIKVLFLKLQLL